LCAQPWPTEVPVLSDGWIGEYFINMKEVIISRDPDVMGGTAVFCGTRVPVQTLLDYLEAGESIDDFLAGFPSVTREQVVAFLQDPNPNPLSDPS
jgi:uncharacterized protein (DUF433 family)